MKYLVIPDSFKGSLEAEKFIELIKSELTKEEIDSSYFFPAFDGGDGFSKIITKIVDGVTLTNKYADGNFKTKVAQFGMKNRTAYIGVSDTSSLPLTEIKDPKITTTYGLGQQILNAIEYGCDNIVIGLGGSSTNDGGCGMLAALGTKFFNEYGDPFIPVGGDLIDIQNIELDNFYTNIQNVKFTCLCDVDNPLLGKNGCSYIFAKQKGAKEEEFEFLDNNMKNYYIKTNEVIPNAVDLNGAGAAGGLGYALKYYLNATIVSGANYFLDLIDFCKRIKEVDVVITGEGRFDKTSLNGKICGTIAKLANKYNKPCLVFCGCNGDLTGIPENTKVYSLLDPSLSTEDNYALTESHLIEAFKIAISELNK